MRITKQHRKHGKGVAGLSSLLPGPNRVKVGFPAGEATASNIEKATWLEFGTRGGASGGGWGGPIPERPFMRNAIRDNRKSYSSAMRAAAAQIIRKVAMGDHAGRAKLHALRKLGIQAQGDIQGEIATLMTPPNSPVTVKLKGSDKPLIDKGNMHGSVTYRIED